MKKEGSVSNEKGTKKKFYLCRFSAKVGKYGINLDLAKMKMVILHIKNSLFCHGWQWL